MIESPEDKLIRHLSRISFDEMITIMSEKIDTRIKNNNYMASEDLEMRYEFYNWTQDEVNEFRDSRIIES